MFAKTVALLLLAVILQAEAVPATNQEDSSVSKLFSPEVAFNALKLTSFIGENSEILEELIPSVSSIIYKMATCKTETTAIVSPHIEDVMACINITTSLYDMEIFLYHTFQFGVEVYDNALDLVSDIQECRNGTSNVFDIIISSIECTITSVENSSSLFREFWNRIAELVVEMKSDVDGLIENVKECKGVSSTAVIKAFHAISTQC